VNYCPNCGQSGVQGVKFCPRCGQKLMGSDLEEGQSYAFEPTAPLKETSWFRRHLNWTMVLVWLGAILGAFVAGLIVSSSNPFVSYGDLEVLGFVIGLAILIPGWGWALKKKNRSLWWLLLGLFVPFGFIVLLCLADKSQASASRTRMKQAS